MPILPGLMGADDSSAPPATTLADIISQLDDDQVTELVAAAEAAGFTDAEVSPVAAEDVNPDLEQPEQPVAGLEGAAADEGVDDSGMSAEDVVNPDDDEGVGDEAESDEEAASEMEGTMGVDAILASAVSAFEGLDDQLLAITGYQDQATENEEAGADPTSIADLVEKAQEAIDNADVAVEDCKSAAKADDAHAAAIAAMQVLRAQRNLAKLVELAATYADVTTAPEPGPQDDPAVKLWAQHMAPKTGMLGGG